jgi:hypothetical protein
MSALTLTFSTANGGLYVSWACTTTASQVSLQIESAMSGQSTSNEFVPWPWRHLFTCSSSFLTRSANGIKAMPTSQAARSQ